MFQVWSSTISILVSEITIFIFSSSSTLPVQYLFHSFVLIRSVDPLQYLFLLYLSVRFQWTGFSTVSISLHQHQRLPNDSLISASQAEITLITGIFASLLFRCSLQLRTWWHEYLMCLTIICVFRRIERLHSVSTLVTGISKPFTRQLCCLSLSCLVAISHLSNRVSLFWLLCQDSCDAAYSHKSQGYLIPSAHFLYYKCILDPEYSLITWISFLGLCSNM